MRLYENPKYYVPHRGPQLMCERISLLKGRAVAWIGEDVSTLRVQVSGYRRGPGNAERRRVPNLKGLKNQDSSDEPDRSRGWRCAYAFGQMLQLDAKFPLFHRRMFYLF